MKTKFLRSFNTLSALAILLNIANAHALSDKEAIAEGMTELSVYEEQLLKDQISLEKDTASANSATDIPDEFKAEVVIVVNKAPAGTSQTAQKALVYHKGYLTQTFTVSTGKETKVTATSGKVYVATTPKGYFRPQTIWKEYQSATWVGAHMNFPVFFYNGIALHATTPDHFDKLGQRDSGGCVRFRPEDAQWLNELVLETGSENYELRPVTLVASGKKIKRTRVLGGQIDVAQVDRNKGTLSTTRKLKSWDTLIVVRDIRTP